MNAERKRFDIKSMLFGVIAGACVVLSVAAATTSGTRDNWEYKVVQGKVVGNEATLENAINSQTAQGWDLVSASPSVDQYGFAVLRREKK